MVPGAVTGALPPLIGWVAAGGGVWDKSIIFLEFLFFTGQIPHFWLLILKYGEEYKKAGFPSLTNILSSDTDKKANIYLGCNFSDGCFIPVLF